MALRRYAPGRHLSALPRHFRALRLDVSTHSTLSSSASTWVSSTAPRRFRVVRPTDWTGGKQASKVPLNLVSSSGRRRQTLRVPLHFERLSAACYCTLVGTPPVGVCATAVVITAAAAVMARARWWSGSRRGTATRTSATVLAIISWRKAAKSENMYQLGLVLIV